MDLRNRLLVGVRSVAPPPLPPPSIPRPTPPPEGLFRQHGSSHRSGGVTARRGARSHAALGPGIAGLLNGGRLGFEVFEQPRPRLGAEEDEDRDAGDHAGAEEAEHDPDPASPPGRIGQRSSGRHSPFGVRRRQLTRVAAGLGSKSGWWRDRRRNRRPRGGLRGRTWFRRRPRRGRHRAGGGVGRRRFLDQSVAAVGAKTVLGFVLVPTSVADDHPVASPRFRRRRFRRRQHTSSGDRPRRHRCCCFCCHPGQITGSIVPAR